MYLGDSQKGSTLRDDHLPAQAGLSERFLCELREHLPYETSQELCIRVRDFEAVAAMRKTGSRRGDASLGNI